MLRDIPFYQFVREERFFCSILAHLLLQEGPNLKSFLGLVAKTIGERPRVENVDVQHAEIYLEFSLLRDRWHRLGTDNEAKRDLIRTLLSELPELEQDGVPAFPEAIADFNEFFMGPRGRRIGQDISSPGQWSVAALSERFGGKPEEFRGFCKFKWSFNIKPDMVVLVPGWQPLCIEAKLESKEGQYPSSSKECAMFDELFGVGQRRVGQIELQQFMFRILLGEPCQSLFIGRTDIAGSGVPFLSWQDVFGELDLSSSIGFVRRVIEENRHLAARR